MGSATLDLVFSKSSKGFLDDQPHPERSHIIELVVNLRTDSRLLTPRQLHHHPLSHAACRWDALQGAMSLDRGLC